MPIPVGLVLQGIVSTAPAVTELLKVILPLVQNVHMPDDHKDLVDYATEEVKQRRSALAVLTNTR
jgi:hypothetical protein